MPERQIDTFLSEVDKPDKPEEQPEDIAQPELDLAPLTGLMYLSQSQKQILKLAALFLEMENIYLFLRLCQSIQDELRKEVPWAMRLLNLR